MNGHEHLQEILLALFHIVLDATNFVMYLSVANLHVMNTLKKLKMLTWRS
jgi:hypothetical protein